MKASDVAPAVPVVAVQGLTIAGVALPVWVQLVGLIYTLMLIIDKAPVVLERYRQMRAFLRKEKPDVKAD